MSLRWPDKLPVDPPGFSLPARTAAFILAVGALAMMASCATAHARCFSPAMQALAQEHSNDMARRDHLDHDGFFQRRGPAGARAENVAYGHPTEAQTIAQWRRSPPHAANMRLPGCWGIAHADARSGRRYWTMEIGP